MRWLPVWVNSPLAEELEMSEIALPHSRDQLSLPPATSVYSAVPSATVSTITGSRAAPVSITLRAQQGISAGAHILLQGDHTPLLSWDIVFLALSLQTKVSGLLPHSGDKYNTRLLQKISKASKLKYNWRSHSLSYQVKWFKYKMSSLPGCTLLGVCGTFRR